MFELLFNLENNKLWDDNTFILYCSIIFTVTLLAVFSQISKSQVLVIADRTFRLKHKINYFFYLLLFLILAFFSAFRNVGTDLYTYREIFALADNSAVYSFGNEPGFILMNQILRFFSVNENLPIVFFSFLSLYFVYKTLEFFFDDIDISISVFCFVSIFYFQSYSLVRIYLVSYFLCYTIKLLLQGKIWLYVAIVLFCTMFHYSSVLMIFPVIFYWIYKTYRKLFVLSVLCFCIGCLFSVRYLSYLNIFERYEGYVTTSVEGGVGMGQFIFHLPLFFFILYLWKRYTSVYLDLLLVYSIFSLIYGCLGYWIPMIGRTSVYFMPIYILFVPAILALMKKKRDKNYHLCRAVVICYALLKAYLYFSEYLFLDGIMPYETI